MSLVYLQHHEIDMQKWDACIKNSFNTHIYAFSWYLNITAEKWDALVLDDYQKVMPLPYKKRLWLYLTYTPAFCYQLGVFSTNKINQDVVDMFIAAIPHKFSSILLHLNKFNKPTQRSIFYKESYEIDLIQDYSKIFDNYSNNIKNVLYNFDKKKYTIKYNNNPKETFDFLYKNSLQKAFQIDISKLYPLINVLSKYGIGKTYTLYNSQGKILSVAFFLVYLNKASLLFFSSLPIKNEQPLTYLINEFIHSHTNKNITLDISVPKNFKYKSYFTKDIGCAVNVFPILKKGNQFFNFVSELQF